MNLIKIQILVCDKPGQAASTAPPGTRQDLGFGSLPDGGVLLASGSYDGMVRLWDPATGELVGELLYPHTGAVTAVASGRRPMAGFCWPAGATTAWCGSGTRTPAWHVANCSSTPAR